MKKMIPVLFMFLFLVGIGMILTAADGVIANYESANVAGIIVSVFSGIYIGIFLHHYLKK